VVAVPAGHGISKVTNVDPLFVGSDLAPVCHCRRSPFNSTPGFLLHPPITLIGGHRYFLLKVLVILNLNGRFSIPSNPSKKGIN
jgi:hypothetical protein